MKKIYSLLTVLLPLIAQGQITITQSDLPAAGWGYINAVDSNYTAAIPPGGAAQSWNYANLQNLSQDSLLFVNAAGTPYAGLFPSANLAAHDTTYVYFTANSTGLYINGAQAPGGVFNGSPLIYNPLQKMIPVPFTYNNTDNSFYRFVYQDSTSQIPLSDSIRIIQHTDESIIADGYGSLTLPNGTHPNTLRIKTTKLETDSIFVHNTVTGWTNVLNLQNQTTNFRWVQNGGGTLLLEITADSLGQNALSSSYLIFFGTVGINETGKPVSVNIYPNPASDKITFTFENDPGELSGLTIFNASGQAVESYDIPRNNPFSLSTSHLPEGLYSYLIKNAKGIHSKGKFVVIH
jgi:type IX secretion system substrate protein